MEDCESGKWEGNKHKSPTFDILLAGKRLGLISINRYYKGEHPNCRQKKTSSKRGISRTFSGIQLN